MEQQNVRQRNWVVSAVISLAIFAVVAFVGIGSLTNWFGLASPRFVPNTNYKFEYSKKTTYGAGNATIAGRDFQVDEETVFPVPEKGTRGEIFLVEDTNLPENTFRLVERNTPEIRVGGVLFQKSYPYVEIRYHMVNKEPQTIVPHLKPKNP